MRNAVTIATMILSMLVAGCGGGGGGGGNSSSEFPPTLQLIADADTITPGGNITLTWSSSNALSCISSNGWSGAKPTSGSQLIQNLTATTTFTLECTGAGGSVSRSLTINISDSPTQYKTPYPYVDILHTSFVFDKTRNRLYAYVPSGDAKHPNTFAVINMSDKTVYYTNPVDFIPFTMTLSHDGSYLYVGSARTHEVIRLSLPDFSINMRFDLGSDPAAPSWWQKDKKFDAGHIAVSPLDPELFAVSLIDNTYWTCAVGLRIYKNGNMQTQFYNWVDTWVGDIVSFDETGTQLTTLCSGTIPDIVARLTYESGSLHIIGEAQRGASGVAQTLEVKSNAILTGAGSKFDMPGFTLRGALPPLTAYMHSDPAPMLHACVFADDTGNVAACLSHTDYSDETPTFRAFVLYELTDANHFSVVPLDLPMSRGTSRIIRIRPGEFAVSVGYNDANPEWITPYAYLHQNTRIYFLSGINTNYP